MDKPDAKKPESIPADQVDLGAESDPPNPPCLARENPNPSDQERSGTSKSDSQDSPPLTPSAKRKLKFSCLGSPAKKFGKGSLKKESQEEKDSPKKEKFKPPPLKLTGTGSVEKKEPPPSPSKILTKGIKLMQISVEKSLKAIQNSFKNEYPVKIYTRPTGFKLAPANEEGDEEPYVSPFFDVANYMTHNKMIGIPETKYFELSIHKIPTDPNIRKMLGARVKFNNSKCTLPADKCFPCNVECCQVCPHQFECNCTEKYFDTDWCSHLHLAKRVELHKYSNHARLFISPASIHSTAHRHLRAFVQGETKMWEAAPDFYEERFEYLKRSQPFKVTKVKTDTPKPCSCPPYSICKRCKACFCHWVCTCPDYWLYNQVCEHLHLVTMLRHEHREELFKKLGDYGKDDDFVEPMPDRGINMVVEHENSFLFKKEIDVTEINDTKWKVVLFPGRGQLKTFTVTAESDKDLCVCGKPEATASKFCVSCNICMYHYKCDCDSIEDSFICIHVHAVARKYQPRLKEETLEDKKKRLEEIVRRYDEFLDIDCRSTFIERQALGPMNSIEIEPESVGVLEKTGPQADGGEHDKVGHEAVKDESTNPAQEPMDKSEATGPSQVAAEATGPSQVAAEAAGPQTVAEVISLSQVVAEETGPSQATIDKSDTATQAVKDESDPAQEPTDK